MRIYLVSVLALLGATMPAFPGPALSPSASASVGGSAAKEADYDTAIAAEAQARLGLRIGRTWGAQVIAGASYQLPSAFTEDWYRYRGFFGLELGAGPRYGFGRGDAYLVAGAQLARYDHALSYFWFPFVEPGVSTPILSIGRLAQLEAGLSAPVRFRADSLSASLRAVLTLSLKPEAPRPEAGE